MRVLVVGANANISPVTSQSASEGRIRAALGATRVFETSHGWIGIEMGGIGRRASIVPWFDRWWVSPGDEIAAEPTEHGLAAALTHAGLAEAEAETLARLALAEWESKVAELPTQQAPAAKPDGTAFVRPALVVTPALALWAIGAGYLVLRAWRTVA